jgi:hypothetical protein
MNQNSRTIEKTFCTECDAEAESKARQQFNKLYANLVDKVPFLKWPPEARQAWDDMGEDMPPEQLCCLFWNGDQSISLCHEHLKAALQDLNTVASNLLADIIEKKRG